MDPFEWGKFLGLFDGEGYIQGAGPKASRDKKGRLRGASLGMEMKDLDTLEWVQRLVGGRVRPRKKIYRGERGERRLEYDFSKWNQTYLWSLPAVASRQLAREMAPALLSQRRRDRLVEVFGPFWV